ncbi:MAG: M1 family metallopeptidase [Actinomycetota bacterium]|nr:M1 family metallopeptidase [Actinomycetota bacterium]
MTQEPYRLYEYLKPQNYDLFLAPDIENATFSGRVTIDCELAVQASNFRLNYAELEFAKVEIEQENNTIGNSFQLDEQNEIVEITTVSPLNPGDVRITIEFTGILNDKLAGFYKSHYRDHEGNNVAIATTQFEATDARRAFPCFDEPSFKATYDISLEIDQDHLAISNGAEVSQRSLGNGKKLVVFERTMKMSTYLVAFIVGRLEATEATVVRGIPIRVVHRPGWGDMTKFAIKVAEHSLNFFTDFFGIDYPGTKMDLIAIPDFAAGAMENLGAITFREPLVVIEESTASQPELERAVDVIAHEIAHMWFGDLATMKWWNGIWLNEAFATYMELLCCDAFEPKWKRWVSFGISKGRAQDVDALHATRPIEFPVNHPSDCQGMFDLLTYEKGGSVLRMLERFIGMEKFRSGVSNYLRKYSYANAETTDLWDAIEEAEDAPVRSIMDSWVFQGGLPVVTVERAAEGFRISQRPFSFIEKGDLDSAIGSNWHIPVGVRSLSGSIDEKFLLEGSSIDYPSKETALIVNSHGDGYFHVLYSPEILDELKNHLGSLEEIEAFNLISDSFAFVVGNMMSIDDFFDLAAAYRSAGIIESSIDAIIARALATYAKAAGSAASERVVQLADALFGPVLESLGFETSEDDTASQGASRRRALEILGTIGKNQEVIAFANDQFRLDMSQEKALDPELASSIISIVAHNGDEADYAFVLDRYRNAQDPVEEQRYLSGLGSFEDPSLIDRTLALAMNEIRSQDAPFVLYSMLASASAGEPTFNFIRANYERLVEHYPASAVPRMLEGVSSLFAPNISERATEVRNFLSSVSLPETGKRLIQIKERFEVNQVLASQIRSNVR